MKDVVKIHLPVAAIEETVRSVRTYGEHGCEGLVLWLGRVEGMDAHVERVMTPPQRSIKNEDGVGYFITNETLLDLNKFLAAERLRLIAQVHSHPQAAYHSAADDRYCIVTVEGGVSLVIPDFGFGQTDLHRWAIYRLWQGRWGQLSKSSVRELFLTDRNCEEASSPGGMLSKIIKLFSKE